MVADRPRNFPFPGSQGPFPIENDLRGTFLRNFVAIKVRKLFFQGEVRGARIPGACREISPTSLPTWR